MISEQVFKMLDMLRELEWSGHSQYSDGFCPLCWNKQHQGHAETCKYFINRRFFQ